MLFLLPFSGIDKGNSKGSLENSIDFFGSLKVHFNTKNMSTSYQLSFYLRKSRTNKTSESDIYLRISVNNKRSALSINRKVDPRKWHPKSEKMMGKSAEATELNNFINVLRNKIKNIHQTFIENNLTISAKSIIDEFKGVNKKTFF